MKRSFALLLAICVISACHPHRPPAVAKGPGSGRSTPTTTVPVAEPSPTGPDLQGLPPDNPTGGDIPFGGVGGDSENGPLADIHFEYDQATLSDEAKGILEKHALWLQAHRDTKATVEGHCDERGTVEYNLALGDKRAQAVREYLVSLGVVAQRLNPVSYGKEKPVDSGHAEASWAKNRRVHFLVTR